MTVDFPTRESIASIHCRQSKNANLVLCFLLGWGGGFANDNNEQKRKAKPEINISNFARFAISMPKNK
jgi:hypothetical protein